jgi:hypothetical protein
MLATWICSNSGFDFCCGYFGGCDDEEIGNDFSGMVDLDRLLAVGHPSLNLTLVVTSFTSNDSR